MLSSSVSATPRPRPPAQMRRSSSLKTISPRSGPPPPYAFSGGQRKPLETLLGSPISSTLRMAQMDVLDPDGRAGRASEGSLSEDYQWTQEKSREELSELLVRADGLIKQREDELSLTSSVCKNLYESNISLKSKHQALLARIPASPAAIGSSHSPLTPMSSTPHMYSGSNSRSQTELSMGGRPSLRTRKVSVTTDDIALLSDQNAELLSKLERLELESSQADKSGRNALKRLEKDIQTLREELEKTQAKSEELEEKQKLSASLGAGEAWQRNKERRAKLKELRTQSGPVPKSDSSEGVWDFAPANELEFSPSHNHWRPVPDRCSSPSPDSGPADDLTARLGSSLLGLSTDAPPMEFSIVSQLLSKIQELEETNNTIIQQQAETTAKLQAMQLETQNISGLYECLGEQELEMLAADSQKEPEGDTIRFRSLRNSLVGVVGNGPGPDSHSGKDTLKKSARKVVSGNDLPPLTMPSASKARKSMFGLFDDPSSSHSPVRPTSPAETGSTLPIPFPSSTMKRSLSWDSQGMVSPALSSLSIASPGAPGMRELNSLDMQARTTLQSELGNELNEQWGLRAATHSRTSSLYDLMNFAASPSPSPMHSRTASLLHEHRSRPTTPISAMGSHLQLNLEPPTPEKGLGRKADPPVTPSREAQAETPAERHKRMSQTIRSRTSRWVDRRFEDSLLGSLISPASSGESSGPAAIPQRIVTAIDTMVENFAALGSTSERAKESPVGTSTAVPSPRAAPGNAIEVRTTEQTVTAAAPEKKTLVKVILELWLWLQFIVIICVFLFAVAKRGPRAILSEADQKRKTRSPR